LINIDFWLIFDPNLPLFLHNLLTNLSKRWVNMFSLAHFVLTISISQFSGILPKNAGVLSILPKRGVSGLEFQQEWSFNEASRTKRIRTSSCCRRTGGCRVHMTLPWSQKLCTVVRFSRAQSLGRTGARACRHDHVSQFFSRLNQFCERRLGWLRFCFKKAGVRRFF